MEVLAAGLCNVVSSNLHTIVNQQGDPAIAATIGYMSIFYSYLIDVLILKIKFTALQYVGLLIIVSLNVLNLTCQKIREDKKKEA